MIRKEVAEFLALGPLPSSESGDEAQIKTLADALARIAMPVSEEEAVQLATCFGPDDCFGLALTLLHLIEGAPGSPLDLIPETEHEWIRRLRERSRRDQVDWGTPQWNSDPCRFRLKPTPGSAQLFEGAGSPSVREDLAREKLQGAPPMAPQRSDHGAHPCAEGSRFKESRFMTLLELVEQLGGLDPELTIYAVEPWTAESVAVVAFEPEDGGLPRVATKIGAEYFLEVSIASEVLEGWQRTEGADSSIKEKCERLIQYAVNDA